MTSLRFYYLALGSNLSPAINIARGLSMLQAQFNRVLVWPVVETQPTAMHTEKQFYNTLVIVRCGLSPAALKSWCNQVEISLGRDRSDPLSSQKDRPLDIDILAHQEALEAKVTEQFDEPYVRQVLHAGKQPNGECRRVALATGYLGETASTIYADDTTGHVVVVEDGINCLLEGFEAAFHRE